MSFQRKKDISGLETSSDCNNVYIYGRVKSRRQHGSSFAFLDVEEIADNTEDPPESVQVIFNQCYYEQELPNVENAIKVASVGSYLRCVGSVHTTVSGEVSFAVKHWRLLRPQPNPAAINRLMELFSIGLFPLNMVQEALPQELLVSADVPSFSKFYSLWKAKQKNEVRVKLSANNEIETTIKDVLEVEASSSALRRCPSVSSTSSGGASVSAMPQSHGMCVPSELCQTGGDSNCGNLELHRYNWAKAARRVCRHLRGLSLQSTRQRSHRLAKSHRDMITLLCDDVNMPHTTFVALPRDCNGSVTDASSYLGRFSPEFHTEVHYVTPSQTQTHIHTQTHIATESVGHFVDETRLHFNAQKKAPQVLWMVHIIQSFVDNHKKKKPSRLPVHLLDVGGGRGDLAIALAGCLAEDVSVSVVDINGASIAAGRSRAKELELTNVSFREVSIEDVSFGPGEIDIVVGLHICGGLLDFAASRACQWSCACVLVPCCFCKNANLRRLAKPFLDLPVAVSTCPLTESLGTYMSANPNTCEDVVETLCRLSESTVRRTSWNAMIAVNALRVEAMQKSHRRLLLKSEGLHDGQDPFTTLMLEFDISFSPRNVAVACVPTDVANYLKKLE
eukprot:GHVR01054681.1.p1 GENE.GHVR01054681.1~~GHVR01054681.1.p1  ORF type:complete len:619 (+),score=75.90 GHVR01054681.1:792-2648(+)